MPQPQPSSASVFRFLDAREFLQKAYDAEKQKNRSFSHRYIAKAMGAGSSSFFKDILNGKAQLSRARAVKFARLFKLSRPETDYFETLVAFTQAESQEEKDHFLRKLGESTPGNRTVLEAFQLEYFRKWHYAAVRELLAFYDFRGDFEKLADMLVPTIAPAEAEAAVRLLLKLKLIRRNDQGRYEMVDKVVSTDLLVDPEKVRPAIRGNLELALRALDEVPAPTRPFSYLTLSVSEISFAQIRDKLRNVRREILEIVTRDEAVDRVYQLNFQLFPISRNVKRGKK